jgi:hypothetical protein
VLSRVLAFRPASAVGRLPPRSDACPLSLRDLLAAAPDVCFPSFEVGTPELVSGVLVAAKVLHAAVGLSLPRGVSPGPWFDALVRAADEVAAALPFFLSGKVVLEGAAPPAVERAQQDCWRLVDAGLTHIAFDATALPVGERARALREVAGPVQENGLAVDWVLALEEVAAAGGARAAAALVAELGRLGLRPDVVSVRCPAPAEAAAARAQVVGLERLGAAVGGVPVLRRGPVTPALLAAAARSGLRGCEDGGQVAGAGGGEAGAFAEASELIEALGAQRCAPAVASGLAQGRAGDGA